MEFKTIKETSAGIVVILLSLLATLALFTAPGMEMTDAFPLNIGKWVLQSVVFIVICAVIAAIMELVRTTFKG